MEQSEFLKDIERIERQLKGVNASIQNLRFLFGKDRESFYTEALKLQIVLEKMALQGRDLPYYTGKPSVRLDVKKLVQESIPHKIGFTKEGCFSVQVPILLPKKNTGNVDYIRSFLYPAMMDFFKDKPRVRYEDCVIAYRHVYREDYPKRYWRDHDNIEVNQITDIMAVFVLRDDNPEACDSYHTSTVGTTNRTEAYVIPRKDFLRWLEQEKAMPKEGIKLYETMQ